ncbi:maintenance of telomere capping protein 1 [Aspergillus ambiguus]|uniref:DUF5427 domain-containing protein MTC1 n=1 Tax=Aspergillus ambiguus TaxID=176160 RepID=UPI003CCDB636
MRPKNSKPTSDELLAQFDDLGVDSSADQPSKPSSTTAPAAQSEQDILAELDHLASQRPSSGPGTPRLSTQETRSPKPAVSTTASGRTSEDKAAPRKSGESTRASRAANKPTAASPDTEKQPAAAQETPSSSSGGGGWWGGIFATASAAMKQAEAAVKEIQQNEEAQKWAQQVKGNVGALRDLGGELRNMALPTFTSLIHTLAPPISSHERLQIHVTHDLQGYPSLDPMVYAVFSRVMAQVEGGDLLVIQRGQEASPKRGADGDGDMTGNGPSTTTAGWHDGPWWRSGRARSVAAVRGAVEATKLARASAESYASEYFAPRGGVEEAAKQATQVLSESNPVRSSDIFLAIQAIAQTSNPDLFRAGPTTDQATPPGVVDVPDATEEEVVFALYLHDPIHGIAFHALSQAVPEKWIAWLDAPGTEGPEGSARAPVPADIAEIIESGGVDPREWAAEWIDETLSLAVGVVAQRYVARRMGVGEAGVAKGKMRAEPASAVESGAGEAARAL